MPRPLFMAVIVGVGRYAYQRKDGVYVIPISAYSSFYNPFIGPYGILHYFCMVKSQWRQL